MNIAIIVYWRRLYTPLCVIIQNEIERMPQFQVVEVLSKHAGLWITRDKEIMYSQVGLTGNN